jgi:hypothetical protein
MKIYKLKIKSSPMSKMNDMEESPDMGSESESGDDAEPGYGETLREAADLCDAGDHEEAMSMIADVLSMLEEKYA